MQVLLKSDVDHLGYKNDVVDVKRGYWRNFLRPRGLAENVTASRVRELADLMERRRSMDAANASEAEHLKELLDRTTIVISALAGPQGKLFGSVGGADISRVLEATRKLRLDPRRVQLDEPLKTLGTFEVPVDLGHGVKASLTVEVEESKLSEQEIARLEAEKVAADYAAEAARLKAAAKGITLDESGATDADADADAAAADTDIDGDEPVAEAVAEAGDEPVADSEA